MVSTRLARYPFFEEARGEVAERAERLVDVVDDAVLDRAEERVTLALERGETGETASDARVELFSYPVARAVVSVVDEHPVTRRYAWAESVTARDRFVDDMTSEGSFGNVGNARVTFEEIVEEFGMEVRETDEAGTYKMEVGNFLGLASGMSDEEWKLVNRSVDDGWVRVTRDDVLELSREAVRERVADGLPLFVPEEAGDGIEPAVENVREVVAEADITTEIDRVEESEFPPCMETLLAEVREGKASRTPFTVCDNLVPDKYRDGHRRDNRYLRGQPGLRRGDDALPDRPYPWRHGTDRVHLSVVFDDGDVRRLPEQGRAM